MRITHNPMPIICAIFGSLLVWSVVLPEPDNSEKIHKIIIQHQNQILAQEQASKEKEETYITTMPETVIEETAVAVPEEIIACYTHGIDYITAEEYDLLCRVVMSESDIESIECQIAVCETILNRLVMGGYGNSISEVVHQPYAYSLADNGEPTESVQQAVQFALEQQSFPSNMVYFRTDHYHDFGQPYMQIGNTFFSLKVVEP